MPEIMLVIVMFVGLAFLVGLVLLVAIVLGTRLWNAVQRQAHDQHPGPFRFWSDR